MEHAKQWIDVKKMAPPKGGGAYEGLGESCSVQPFYGSAVFRIPLPFTECRGRKPDISLEYKSTEGNGIFGMGFTLKQIRIYRKTSEHIPTYGEEDVFLFHGEELVRKDRQQHGKQTKDIYSMSREESFMRFSHIREENRDWWEIQDREGICYVLGSTPDSVIADPSDPGRIFSWMTAEVTDANGNRMQYQYGKDGYLASIAYGNYTEKDGAEVMFCHAAFHYKKRRDTYCSCRSGFIIKADVLCDRFTMYHRIGSRDVRVRELEFIYDESGLVSLLAEVRQWGFRNKEGVEIQDSLPLLQLSYTGFLPQGPQCHEVELREAQPCVMADLYGEGAAGALFFTQGSMLYSRALGNYQFGEPEEITSFPIYKDLDNGNCMLESLDTNGICNLTIRTGAVNGYYQLEGNKWSSFSPFESIANEAFSQNKEYADLEGDRRSHVLFTTQGMLKYYPNRGRKGVDQPRLLTVPMDFPHVTQNSPREIVTFLDLLGDGLSHRVRVRNGSVECWPNLGYGRFGEKLQAENPPYFEKGFNASCVEFGDLDGSGTTDIIYVTPEYLEIYLNQGGLCFMDPVRIELPELFENGDQILVCDINGSGTSCILYRKHKTEAKTWCLDFTGGAKPYLLISAKNSFGRSHSFTYESSVSLYLADQAVNRQWKIHPPFPVQVLTRMEERDAFSKECVVTAYRYRDGCYDHKERKFYGFGLVEITEQDGHGWGVKKRTYFHIGINYCEEYLPRLRSGLADQDLIAAGNQEEAKKRLYGEEIRQEVYGIGDKEPKYTVENTYDVREILQAEHGQKGIYSLFSDQTLTTYYEDCPDDPRVEHLFVLQQDSFGNQQEVCTVYYPRTLPKDGRLPSPEPVFQEQRRLKLKLERNSYVNLTGMNYRIGINTKHSCYQADLWGNDQIHTRDSLNQLLKEQQQELVSKKCSIYWDDSLRQALPLGQSGFQAVIHHEEYAVLPTESPVLKGWEGAEQLIETGSGLKKAEGYWWDIGTVCHYCGKEGYYLPVMEEESQQKYRTELIYDSCFLKPVKILEYEDWVHETYLEIDYVTLEYCKRTDENKIITSVCFHPLGQVSEYRLEGSALKERQAVITRFDYQYKRFLEHREPVSMSMTISSLNPGQPEQVERCAVVYWDGAGNELETKYPTPQEMWIVRDKTYYTPDGRAVEKYPGFFTDTDHYSQAPEGLLPDRITYDYQCREIKREYPLTWTDSLAEAYVFSAVEYQPWETIHRDQNQTFLKSDYYNSIESCLPGQTDGFCGDCLTAAEKGASFAGESTGIPKDAAGHTLAHITYGKDETRIDAIYFHDPYGKLKKASDQRLLIHGACTMAYTYDLLARTVQEYSADAGVSETLYGSLGLKRWTRDGAGCQKEYQYDQMLRHIATWHDRVLSEKLVYGKNTQKNQECNLAGAVTFHYDSAGIEETKAYSICGLALSQTRKYCQEMETPDWSKDVPLEDTIYRCSYQYDSGSLVTAYSTPDGNTYHYTYDKGGQLNRVVCQEGQKVHEIIHEIRYQGQGKCAFISYGNGVGVQYGYDRSGKRLIRVRAENKNGDALLDLSYAFDPAGNLILVRNLLEAGFYRSGQQVRPLWEYTYDSHYQLVSVQGIEAAGHKRDFKNMVPYREDYTYDTSGNLTQIRHRGSPSKSFTRIMRIREDSSRMREIEITGEQAHIYQAVYDLRGNVLESSANGRYFWDIHNRLARVSLINRDDGNDEECYQYDYEGNRVRKRSVQRSSNGVYDRSEEFVNNGYRIRQIFTGGGFKKLCSMEIRHKDGIAATVYLTPADSETGEPESGLTPEGRADQETGCSIRQVQEIRYCVETFTNCISMETGQDGQVICEEEYYPYGGTAVTRQYKKGFMERYRRYCQKIYDSLTGLYYFGARYYNPCEARMLSPDHSEYVSEDKWQSFYRYRYCGGNPVTYQDPDGHDYRFIYVLVILIILSIAAAYWSGCFTNARAPTPYQRSESPYASRSPAPSASTSSQSSARMSRSPSLNFQSSAGISRSPSPSSSSDSFSPSAPYASAQKLDGTTIIGRGMPFTAAQKRIIYDMNRRRNGGVLRSDLSGILLVAPARSQRGVTPPPNEAQIDHIYPRSRGGTNSYSNAMVLSRAENRAKSNKIR